VRARSLDGKTVDVSAAVLSFVSFVLRRLRLFDCDPDLDDVASSMFRICDFDRGFVSLSLERLIDLPGRVEFSTIRRGETLRRRPLPSVSRFWRAMFRSLPSRLTSRSRLRRRTVRLLVDRSFPASLLIRRRTGDVRPFSLSAAIPRLLRRRLLWRLNGLLSLLVSSCEDNVGWVAVVLTTSCSSINEPRER
jgi:hypothetical protein